ncbi:MAG: cytochrome c oxidase subunit 3 [Isosphaeraceae bacterium]|nr:cytochrome c oxidase subunit 3 [Isosphaeraceae bacterium]
MLLGACFLGIKAIEWHHDYEENLFPGPSYTFKGKHREADLASNKEVPIKIASLGEPLDPGEQSDLRRQAQSLLQDYGKLREIDITAEPLPYRWQVTLRLRPIKVREPDYIAVQEGTSPEAAMTLCIRDLEQRFRRHTQMFFVVYFFMTGLHALHLIIGIVLVGIMAVLSWRGWFSGGGETQIEVTGLYWHFIDIVWVFLYPLLYLIDVHQ